jgi:hypothetical protein
VTSGNYPFLRCTLTGPRPARFVLWPRPDVRGPDCAK